MQALQVCSVRKMFAEKFQIIRYIQILKSDGRRTGMCGRNMDDSYKVDIVVMPQGFDEFYFSSMNNMHFLTENHYADNVSDENHFGVSNCIWQLDRGHSIITLSQNDQNLDLAFPLFALAQFS